MLLKEFLNNYISYIQYIELIDINSTNTLFKGFTDKITRPDYRKYLKRKIKLVSAFQNKLIIYIIGDDKND